MNKSKKKQYNDSYTNKHRVEINKKMTDAYYKNKEKILNQKWWNYYFFTFDEPHHFWKALRRMEI